MNMGGIFCRKYSDSAFIKNGGVLFQFVGHLIDDEAAVRGERIVGLSQQRLFFVAFQDAKGNAGEDIIAGGNAALLDLVGQGGRVLIEDMDAGIVRELAPRDRGKRPSRARTKARWRQGASAGQFRASGPLRPDRIRR